MKKVYETPELEIELYELDGSIAANCPHVPSFGPEPTETHGSICDEFDDGGGGFVETYSMQRNASFDEKTCDCYVTATGGYFTS